MGSDVFKGSGGWIVGAVEELLRDDSISLSIASPSPLVSELKIVQGERIKYYVFPLNKGKRRFKPSYESVFRFIKDDVRPDLVHIHGTEFPFGLSYIRACGSNHVVASMQGMVSVICKYSIGDIPLKALLKYTTISDLFLRKSLWNEKKNLFLWGQSEIQLIKELRHVIGRTTWDRAHCWAINPEVHYHFCNETLRPEFYSGGWSYKDCNKYTVFVSQPKNSVKGFHQLLKALPLVLTMYPDTIIRIPGNLDLFPISLKGQLLQNGYNRYLNQIIKNNKLKDHLVFLGPLTAEEMKKEYLSANVFVSCSSIENSSNSIGEAQILGTPCISSYVGGCDDLVVHGETGLLYRFEEVEMLAYYICKVFSGEYDLDTMSRNEIVAARKRHDQQANNKALLDIYSIVMNNDR